MKGAIVLPNFIGEYPKRTGDTKKDVEILSDWAISLIDELKFVLSNLDECNIAEYYAEKLTQKNE